MTVWEYHGGSIQCMGCGGQGEKPRITNADRIRAMTDEEMARFFDLEAFLCPWCDMSCGDVEEIPCRQCLLKWLKQEVCT